ncbi:hypothetical protein ONS95_009614 [Cadophora gregata]|uniref:uncharacterized protein n=1 Tax=Cadophora gregata TaxID=51156 RepID=UPI0026DC9F62|nr:uncharacterized protein ONS95_009614 [Cadophora gregata]KAK0124668.1 hypothetical protein ONS95_009614 [Cadophora gregata]
MIRRTEGVRNLARMVALLLPWLLDHGSEHLSWDSSLTVCVGKRLFKRGLLSAHHERSSDAKTELSRPAQH